MERGQHSLAREGIIAGILGAAVVALWFLILDLVIQGRPLFTPNLLGQLVLDRGSPVDLTALKPGLIAGYTVLHFALFALFGIALTQLVHLAARYHIWRFALLIVVVAFEVFFIGFSFMFFAGTAGVFHWWAILIGNTAALLVMGYYLLKTHPGLREAMSSEELGSGLGA